MFPALWHKHLSCCFIKIAFLLYACKENNFCVLWELLFRHELSVGDVMRRMWGGDSPWESQPYFWTRFQKQRGREKCRCRWLETVPKYCSCRIVRWTTLRGQPIFTILIIMHRPCCLRQLCFWLVFVRFPVRIWAWTQTTLNEVYRDISQFFRVLQISHDGSVDILSSLPFSHKSTKFAT